MTPLSTQEIIDAHLADWRKLGQRLHARFLVADLAAAASFTAAVAAAGAALDHYPDLSLRPGVVDVAVGTRRGGVWVMAQDVELARAISDVAREHRLESRPGEVAQLEFGLDTAQDDRLGPFWSALLTGSTDNAIHDSVLDPTDRVPNLWFQGSAPITEAPLQRWHPDLWLAPEVADDRIAAALAAGGTVVDTSSAPSFTVLADPDGNKVCVCTYLERP